MNRTLCMYKALLATVLSAKWTTLKKNPEVNRVAEDKMCGKYPKGNPLLKLPHTTASNTAGMVDSLGDIVLFPDSSLHNITLNVFHQGWSKIIGECWARGVEVKRDNKNNLEEDIQEVNEPVNKNGNLGVYGEMMVTIWSRLKKLDHDYAILALVYFVHQEARKHVNKKYLRIYSMDVHIATLLNTFWKELKLITSKTSRHKKRCVFNVKYILKGKTVELQELYPFGSIEAFKLHTYQMNITIEKNECIYVNIVPTIAFRGIPWRNSQ